MPYGAPVAVPSARLDLTKYALKNLKRFAQVAAGDGNANRFLCAYKNTLLTDLADRSGPPFNRIVYQSLDDGATWNVFHTVGVNSMPQALTFQWNALGNNLNIILAHGTTSGNSGIDLFTASGPAWTTQLATGVTTVSAVQTADPKNFGMLANGTTFNATMIAVGNGGSIWRSTDGGVTWSARVSGTGLSFTDVATNGAGVWIALTGSAGTICRSTDDGLTWSAHTPAILPDAANGAGFNITFGLGKFFGRRTNPAGPAGELLTSIDGLSWEIVFSSQSLFPYCVGFDQDTVFLAGCDTGRFLLSRDLMTFDQLILPPEVFNPGAASLGIAGNIRMRTLSFDGSYQSNILRRNRWLFSCTDQAAITNNPLIGAQNLI